MRRISIVAPSGQNWRTSADETCPGRIGAARGCVGGSRAQANLAAGIRLAMSRPCSNAWLRHRAMQHQSRSRNARQQVEEIEIPKRLQQLAHILSDAEIRC